MSRRAAAVTQADVARALRAAKSAGGGWRVEILPDGVIRITAAAPVAEDPSLEPEPDSPFARGLGVVP